jgi:hypothetical protein
MSHYFHSGWRIWRRLPGPAAWAWCLLLWASLASVQGQGVPGAHSVLLKRINIRDTDVGTKVFAKTLAEWHSGPCTVRAGTAVEGTVTALELRKEKAPRNAMSIGFTPIGCAGGETATLIPILVAVQSRPNDDVEVERRQQELSNAFASMVGSHIGGGRGMDTKVAPVPLSLRPLITNEAYAEQPIRAGEVQGIHGVKLTLPTSASEPTILWSHGEFALEANTQFVLVFHARPEEPSHSASIPDIPNTIAASAPAASTTQTKPLPAVPVEETAPEVCVESGCATAALATTFDGEREDRVLSLASYGYRNRSNETVRSMDEDAVVEFLGNDQLLIAFNAHPLISRSQQESGELQSPRMIRALLYSMKSGAVVRRQEWRVPDQGPYLWALNGGRILAHVNDSLIMYGPGLRVLNELKLPGPLAHLTLSPSRKVLLIVTLQERHTWEDHRKLAEFLGPDRKIEEDYKLSLVDDDLAPKGTQTVAYEPVDTALLDSGMVLTRRHERQRWTIEEQSWAKQTHPITAVTSACYPSVSTLPPDLLFVTGCVSDQNGFWYRVLRPNGATLLKGTGTNAQLLMYVGAPSSGKAFAVGVAQADEPVSLSGPGLRASTLDSLAVSVYRSVDGKRLFATRTASRSVNRRSFALSDSGTHLAILSGDKVHLYAFGSPAVPAGVEAAKR